MLLLLLLLPLLLFGWSRSSSDLLEELAHMGGEEAAARPARSLRCRKFASASPS